MKTTSALEFALLGLLKQKPHSGYDLRKTFATTAMRQYSDSPGSIYPALRRLQTKGHIEPLPASPTPQPPTPAPPDPRRKQLFRLTATGHAALLAWLSSPVTHDDIAVHLSETMLRFAFMDGNVPRSTAIRFLDDYARELSSYIELLRPQWKTMQHSAPAHTGVLAFQSGIEGMEAQLDWARRTRALLAEATQ